MATLGEDMESPAVSPKYTKPKELNHVESTIASSRKGRRTRATCLGFNSVPMPKRKKSSDKEKQRNMDIKKALHTLRLHIIRSFFSKSMPYAREHKDLSRIRTLRLAKEYILHLRRILDGEMVYCKESGSYRCLDPEDFESVVNKEMRTNNSYKDRADQELAEQSDTLIEPMAATSDSLNLDGDEAYITCETPYCYTTTNFQLCYRDTCSLPHIAESLTTNTDFVKLGSEEPSAAHYYANQHDSNSNVHHY